MGVCCNRQCNGECEECDAAGTVGTCTARTGSTCSGTVSCSTTVKGFSSSDPTKCEGWTQNITPTCNAQAVCDMALQQCTGSTKVLQTCGSAACGKACAPFAASSTANQLGKVCHLNTAIPACMDIECE